MSDNEYNEHVRVMSMYSILEYHTLFQRTLDGGIEQGGAVSCRQEHEMADVWNLLFVDVPNEPALASFVPVDHGCRAIGRYTTLH
jgi:hypothetical protein